MSRGIRESRSRHDGANRRSSLMRRVHLENVKNRRDRELLADCQKRSMQIVDELGRVRHGDLIRVPIENVECDAGNERIAQRRKIYEQVAGIDAGIRFVPRAPLVDYQLDLPLLIDFAHNLPMVAHEFFHAIGFGEKFIPIVDSEIDRTTFPGCPAIIMQGAAVDSVERAVALTCGRNHESRRSRLHWARMR